MKGNYTKQAPKRTVGVLAPLARRLNVSTRQVSKYARMGKLGLLCTNPEEQEKCRERS